MQRLAGEHHRRRRGQHRVPVAASDLLHFQVVGVIKDVERLKALFDLFTAVLDQLCRIGSAYKQELGIEL
jgi:hypothetical protein